MRDHRTLRAFKLADGLVKAVYRVTRPFPREELYGLTSQLRRAAVSVPANIVEGCGRESSRELLNFLNIANGSLRETGYLIGLARDLGYLGKDVAAGLTAQYQDCCKVLAAFMTRVRRK